MFALQHGTRRCLRNFTARSHYSHATCIPGARNRWFSESSLNDDIEQDIRSLPWQYLRALDPSNYDASTHQRVDVLVDKTSGKPIIDTKSKSTYSIREVDFDGNHYHVTWNDGLQSQYYATSVERAIDRWKEKPEVGRVLWTDLTEDDVRESPTISISFPELMTESGMSQSLKALYQYGIVLVTDTPIDDDGTGIAVIGAAFGGGTQKNSRATSVMTNYKDGGDEITLRDGTDGPMRTLYGTVWSTSTAGQAEGASVADSAYGNDGLPLHTDMTYLRDPPGLQIFTMVQPAIQGGESVYADGFSIAERLRSTDPDAFDVLSSTVRRYRCIDEATGWNLEASGCVIEVDKGRLKGIRHNDLDRLPDLPIDNALPPSEIDSFYATLDRAHAAWDTLIAEDKSRLVIKLKPGDTMVVANQRCFHGRYSFQSSASSPRAVMGCYVSQDEVDSRLRMEGFYV